MKGRECRGEEERPAEMLRGMPWGLLAFKKIKMGVRVLGTRRMNEMKMESPEGPGGNNRCIRFFSFFFF